MRKLFYISPQDVQVDEIAIIFAEWLENKMFELLDLDKLSSEFTQTLRRKFPWIEFSVDMVNLNEKEFGVTVYFSNLKPKRCKTFKTKVCLW